MATKKVKAVIPANNSRSVSPGEIIRLGKDEMNLIEHPFASLWKNEAAETEIYLEWETTHPVLGKAVKASWRVTGDPKMGLPTVSDERVYLVLMELTREAGFSQTVAFTRYDLLKRLNWPDHHKYYQMLKDALTRLSSVNITAENAFWNPRAKSFSTVGFHILENYEIFSESRGRKSKASQEQGSGLPLSYFKWNDVMFQSFLNGNIRSIDLEFALSLNRPLTLRLFRYLDKKVNNSRQTFEVSLRELCKLHLGMAVDGRYDSDLKASLKPAHAELIERGFLESAIYAAMKTRKGTKVCYIFPSHLALISAKEESEAASIAANELKPDATAEQPMIGESDPLLQQMLELKISPEVARELRQNTSTDQLRLQLDCLDDRAPRDHAATFVKAVREDWEAPATYLERQKAVESAEKSKTDKVASKARKAAQEGLARAETATAEQEAARLDVLWEQLDATTREQIETQARQRLGVLGQSGRAQGALKAMRRNLLRERLN